MQDCALINNVGDDITSDFSSSKIHGTTLIWTEGDSNSGDWRVDTVDDGFSFKKYTGNSISLIINFIN